MPEIAPIEISKQATRIAFFCNKRLRFALPELRQRPIVRSVRAGCCRFSTIAEGRGSSDART
jgi:hypothetical protein